MSAIDATHPDAVVIYIDGFNNPGFSGGPIVFWDDGYLSDSGNPYILWLRDSGIAEHLTRDLYGTGSTATAC